MNQNIENLHDIINQLQTKVAMQEEHLQKQSRQIQQLEDRLVAYEFKIGKAMKSDAWLDDLKKDILTSAQSSTDTNIEIAPSSTEESHSQAHNPRQALEQMHRYEEQATLARNDVDRLNHFAASLQNQLDQLQQQVNKRIGNLDHIEAIRRADTQRVAELQGELPALQRKVEANLAAKIEVLQKQLPQFGEYQMAMERMRQEAREERQQMEYKIAERERQMKVWLEMSQSHEQRLSKYEGMFERYAEQYQANKRLLESLYDFQERLQRDQHQTNELYRLTEERQQMMFEKWKTEYEQRWQRESKVWKPSVTEAERNLKHLQEQIDTILKFKRTVEQQLDIVLQILEEDVHHRMSVVEDWQQRFEAIARSE